MAATLTMREGDSWRADPLPDVRAAVPSPVVTDWLSDAPLLFDVSHDSTARFYAAGSGVTPCLVDGEEPGDLARHLGDTPFDVYEKRAVVADGSLVRLWPEQHGTELDFPPRFHLVVPPDGRHEMLVLGAGYTLPHPLFNAEHLSARLGLPIVVALLLESRSGP